MITIDGFALVFVPIAIDIMDSQLKIAAWCRCQNMRSTCVTISVLYTMQSIQVNTHHTVCVSVLSSPRCTWAIKGISKWTDYNDAEVCQHTAYPLDCRRFLCVPTKIQTIIAVHIRIFLACCTFSFSASDSTAVAQFSLRSSSLWSKRKKK